ncbi:flavodoxin family protein [Clostridium sp.]|uniref:flavodoxin family protein n=1 Tax=Clostridium sp. TaxID=1506 RepID=UPI003217809A
MKKLLVINGSPNKHGHTTKILDDIMIGVDKDIEINYVNCYSLDIKPCIDCKNCSNIQGICSIEDSMTMIYKHIKESNIIILASPMYFGMFPAPLKSLIDRCQVIWSEKFIFNNINKENKKGIFIFNGGSSWDNMFINMENIGKYLFNTLDCSIIYKILIDNTDKKLEHLEINKDKILKCRSLINNS